MAGKMCQRSANVTNAGRERFWEGIIYYGFKPLRPKPESGAPPYQLRIWGSDVSSPSKLWGRAPVANSFQAYRRGQKTHIAGANIFPFHRTNVYIELQFGIQGPSIPES